MRKYIAASAVAVALIVALGGCAKSPHSSSVKIYIQQHQPDKAVREGKAWVKDEPQNPAAHYWLARAYSLAEDYVDAAKELDSVYKYDKTGEFVSKFTDFEKVVYQNAGLKVKDKNPLEAVHYFKQALKITPNDTKVMMTISALYGLALTGTPGSDTITGTLPDSTTGNALKDSMFTYLRKAYQLDPNNPDILYRAAVAYETYGEIDSAKAYLEKLLQVKPDMAKAHYRYGILLFNSGDYKKAAEEFRKSYELDTTMVEGLFNCAQALLKAGDYDEAIKVAEQYTKVRPDDPNGWFFLGGSYVSKNNPSKEDLQKAVEALTKAIQLNPNNPLYYDIRAAAYGALGESDKALQDINKSDELKGKKGEQK